MDLARHYRPKRFDEIKGQSGVPELQQLVRQSADAETLTSRLFVGPAGTGKTSTARVLAAALNCESPDDGEPCGECKWCNDIFSRHSTALLEYDAGLYGGVDTIRKLRHELSYKAAANGRSSSLTRYIPCPRRRRRAPKTSGGAPQRGAVRADHDGSVQDPRRHGQ
jgi:DNA polymerase III subunit gamma/tau